MAWRCLGGFLHEDPPRGRVGWSGDATLKEALTQIKATPDNGWTRKELADLARRRRNVISAAPDMLEALRKVPLFRLADNALGWECVGCGKVSGITPDGSNRHEECEPDCYVRLVEAAIAKAEAR